VPGEIDLLALDARPRAGSREKTTESNNGQPLAKGGKHIRPRDRDFPMNTETCSQGMRRSAEKRLRLPVSEFARIPMGRVVLTGHLGIPRDAAGLVLFAHGSGSSQRSPRNQLVARALREAGSGTLLFDLLTQDEETGDDFTGHLRFNIRGRATGGSDAMGVLARGSAATFYRVLWIEHGWRSGIARRRHARFDR